MDIQHYEVNFLLGLYRKMSVVRQFELATLAERSRPKKERMIPGYLHSYVGQEAIAVGVSAALRPLDKIVSTHRGHGHLIAKGANVQKMMSELAGKSTGYTRGRGGPLHMVDLEQGILGTQGIVTAGIPIAIGSAISSQVLEEGWITAAFLGDGAIDQGVFHEALNIAALWNLQIIFLCENNKFSEGTPISQHLAVKDLVELVSSYGIYGKKVDGNDVLAVYEVTSDCVKRLVENSSPVFIEADTYRLHGHYHGDKQKYQDLDEIKYWKQRDPLKKMKQALLNDPRFIFEQINECEQYAIQVVENAISFARSSSDPKFAELFHAVYAETHGGNVF